MSVNFNPAIGYGSAMGGGMPQMSGMSNSAEGSGNVFQSFKSKYGCEICYKKSPYWVECPTAVQPVPLEVIKPSRIKGIFSRLFGI